MFGNSNKSQESFLELFQSAAQARSSTSNLESPKKEVLRNILTAKASISSPVATSESSATTLKNFLLNGIGKENSGSSEAFDTSDEGEVLVKFKKATLEGKGIPGGMIAVSGSYLAYLVNEKKVRIFNTETGQKCSIDRAHGVFVGLAWSDGKGQPGETFLAVLAEDGEVTIGRIAAESGEEDELSFEVSSILSFPEIGRARSISWNSGNLIGGKSHLAVYGNSTSDIFFVHCSSQSNGKSSFVNTSLQEIKNVDITESGACWVIGRDGFIEKFKYSGSAFEPEFCAKLPVKKLECAKIFEKHTNTYCLVIADGVFSVFAFGVREEDELILISSVPLEIPATEFVINQEFDLALLFSNAVTSVQVVSLQSLHHARTINHSLNSNALPILDACFKSCNGNGTNANFGILFYFNDSICRQDGQFELMPQESESEETITDDECSEVSESEGTQVEPFSMIDDVKENETLEEGALISNVQSIDLESLQYEIKTMVREAVKECLIESIHEVMNSSIQAGFNQISEDLMALTKNLIKAVEGATGNFADVTSDAEPFAQAEDDGSQAVRVLINQGQLGAALRKAVALSNSRLLLEVCQKFEDPFNALDEEQLSQQVLSQMFSLLSLDIDEDTEVKLDWLQEILIQIDFSSESGSDEFAQLAEKVDKLFNDLKSLVNDSLVDGNLQKKMKTVMRLLRKLQMN